MTPVHIALLAGLALVNGPARAAENLITNGNFSAGNTGFTSAYTYSPASNSAEGQYTVRAGPQGWNSYFIDGTDHTAGEDGMMFLANGNPGSGITVWQSGPIAIDPNTRYYFEAWASDVCCIPGYNAGNSPAILEFSVLTGSGATFSLGQATLAGGHWQFFSEEWDSGLATTAVLSLRNHNTAVFGNDFAIDDVHFGQVSSVTSVVPEPQTYAMLAAGLLVLGGMTKRRGGPHAGAMRTGEA